MGKILVVDDEKEMCQLLSEFFVNEGYDVDTALDAKQAIHKANTNQYHFLLVDLVLPGNMNGIDVIKQIRKLYPKIYILAYSGFCDFDISDKVINAGANRFITKPFRHKELFDLMFQKQNLA